MFYMNTQNPKGFYSNIFSQRNSTTSPQFFKTISLKNSVLSLMQMLLVCFKICEWNSKQKKNRTLWIIVVIWTGQRILSHTSALWQPYPLHFGHGMEGVVFVFIPPPAAGNAGSSFPPNEFTVNGTFLFCPLRIK